MQHPTESKHTNRLIHATSPYLLQHAHNPVDWFEWGDEALQKAREEDKPIFLSIGYSACHWCHVMAHECFENEEIADLLNAGFISIKVDREERPDIDEIYMQATVAMTGHGGWPMSVILTPDGVPFFCGTYFPPQQFSQLLGSIGDAWNNQRDQLIEQGGKINDYLQKWANRPTAGEDPIPESTVTKTAETLQRHFDLRLGGMQSQANKFPPSMAMELMLRAYLRTNDSKLLEAIEVTLDHMGRGGIYDHLGGGICRYSTDPNWLVPHFEKMLYDQALVSAIYLDAFQHTRKPFYEEIARGILDYVIEDLQSPGGGFYSTRDADSEGLEGKYYIWTVEQVNDVLGTEDATLFCAFFDVTEAGNWYESRGHAPGGPKNILNISRPLEAVAKLHDLKPQELAKRLEVMKAKMRAARDKRIPPGLDDKILTGWNGMMIASLAKAANVLDDSKYAHAAQKAADFVLQKLRKDGKLLRTYRDGRAHLTGYLSDYAFCIEGLINLYESTFDDRWLTEAVALTDDSIKRYFDDRGGGFFFTASDGERLITRTKDANDGAIPSSNSVHAMNLLRLALLTGNKDYYSKAESIFRAFAPLAERSPGQFDRLLCAVDFYHSKPKEVAIVATPSDPGGQAMRRALHLKYRPNKIVTMIRPDQASSPNLTELIPLLKGKKPIANRTTAFVCRDYRCKKPAVEVDEFVELLDTKE